MSNVGKYDDIFAERRMALAAYSQERRGLPKLSLVINKPAKLNTKSLLRENQKQTLENWGKA